MKALFCIDDTDNIDSIGTGELLENLCAELEAQGMAKGGFVTRHQLFICDEIAYTSHNSSMCCELETDSVEEVAAFAGSYLERECAEGSDPGMCIFVQGSESEMEALENFGKRAQEEVLTKKEAYALAEKIGNNIHLSEHGGTGEGIIGALAGVGLRLSGSDGRVKGKIFPEQQGEILTVTDFCRKYSVSQVVSDDGMPVEKSELVRFDEVTKAVLLQHMVTVIADKKEGYWIPKPKKGKQKAHVGN